MVGAVILFMGAVSGAHLNPGVSLAFAIRGDFPWRRLPGYVIVQLVGAALATVVLVAVVGKHGTAGLTLPGHGVSTTTAMLWEMILTAGLVSVVLGRRRGHRTWVRSAPSPWRATSPWPVSSAPRSAARR